MNQNPEQIARDHIDRLLSESGWLVQSKNKLNLAAGLGVAVTEYRTDTGPVDYRLFFDRKPVGIILNSVTFTPTAPKGSRPNYGLP